MDKRELALFAVVGLVGSLMISFFVRLSPPTAELQTMSAALKEGLYQSFVNIVALWLVVTLYRSLFQHALCLIFGVIFGYLIASVVAGYGFAYLTFAFMVEVCLTAIAYLYFAKRLKRQSSPS